MMTVSNQEVTSNPVDDGPPISVPDSGDTGESGKLKMIVQLVRKCMGIKDIASMCVPPFNREPNVDDFIGGYLFLRLCWSPSRTWCASASTQRKVISTGTHVRRRQEYWHYLDRPDLFAA